MQADAAQQSSSRYELLQLILAFCFGVVFCGILAYAALSSTPINDPAKFFFLRLLAALSAAGVAAVIPGMLNIDIGQGTLVVVRGAGALAVFALVYLVNPPELIRGPTEAAIAGMEGNFAQGLLDDASRQANAILKGDPTNPQAQNILGGVAFYEGDYHKAVERFRGANNAVEGRSIVIKSNYANALVEIGAFDEAIALFKTLDDGSKDHMFTLGRAYLFSGDYKQAHALLSQVPASYWHGAGKVLDATAVHALAKAAVNQDEKSKLERQALDLFREGHAVDPVYWKNIFGGGKEKHMRYGPVTSNLKLVYDQVTAASAR